jgi:hypothetical protein
MLTVVPHSTFKPADAAEYRHPLDAVATRNKDRAAKFTKMAGTFLLGDNPTGGDAIPVRTLDGFTDNDLTTRGVTHAVAAVATVAELVDENKKIAGNDRLSELAIKDAQTKASADALARFVSLAGEVEDFRRTVDAGAREFFAPDPLDPTASADALVDIELRRELRAMPLENVLKVVGGNRRACLAAMRDPLSVDDLRQRKIAAAWSNFRRQEEPARAAAIDDGIRRAEWSSKCIGSARKFLLQSTIGNGAELAAKCNTATLDGFAKAGLDVERGTGRLVEVAEAA